MSAAQDCYRAKLKLFCLIFISLIYDCTLRITSCWLHAGYRCSLPIAVVFASFPCCPRRGDIASSEGWQYTGDEQGKDKQVGAIAVKLLNTVVI